jgi:hypothetical protein
VLLLNVMHREGGRVARTCACTCACREIPVGLTSLVVDGVAIQAVTDLLVRRVGDKLYVDVRIADHLTSWQATQWLVLAFRLPVPSASVTLAVGELDLLNFVHWQKNGTALSTTRLPGGPEGASGNLDGCVNIQAVEGGYTMDLRLDGKLQPSGTPTPSMRHVQAAAHFAWSQADTKVLTPYAGECTGPANVLYVPDQSGYGQDADFAQWQDGVESSCSGATGCHTPPGLPCGSGNHWRCSKCYFGTCLFAGLV